MSLAPAVPSADAQLPATCRDIAPLLLVPALSGIAGIAWAALAGCLLTAFLFLRRYALLADPLMLRLPLLAVLVLAGATPLFAFVPGVWMQMMAAALYGFAVLLLLGRWSLKAAREPLARA